MPNSAFAGRCIDTFLFIRSYWDEFVRPQMTKRGDEIPAFPGKEEESARFLTPWRLKWYPLALLTGLAIGFLIHLLSGEGASTLIGRVGGDYPCFYAAGRIIAQGEGRSLYNSERQQSEQSGLFPGNQEVFIPFPYPPHVALFYAPLSLLPYRLSYCFHTLLMIGAVLLGIWSVRPFGNISRNQWLSIFAVALLYYPLFRGITGGSNTAITLSLIALCWRMVTEKQDLFAGVFLGLLLFKPQYALPLIGLFLLSGRWKTAGVSALMGLILWSIGVWVQGWNWVREWLSYSYWVTRVAAEIDKQNAISWIGFFESIGGTESRLATVVGIIFAGATAAITCWVWWKAGPRGDLSREMGVAICCILLIPPHVFYYDAGLVALPWIVMLSCDWKYKPELILGVWVMGFTQVAAQWLRFSPIFPVVVFTFAMGLWKLPCPEWKRNTL
jgi:hypothetical protein